MRKIAISFVFLELLVIALTGCGSKTVSPGVSLLTPSATQTGSTAATQAGSSTTTQTGSSTTAQAGSSTTTQAGSSTTTQTGSTATTQAGSTATTQSGSSTTAQAGLSTTQTGGDSASGTITAPAPTPDPIQSATVSVTWPSSGETTPLTPFVVSASSDCASGIASIGIYVDDRLVYAEDGNHINHQILLQPGEHRVTAQSSDNCGNIAKSDINLSVVDGSTTFNNLQTSSEWNMSGQKTPDYDNCVDNPGPDACGGITYSYLRGSAVSLTGLASEFDLGGTLPYSDVLFWLHLIGALSSRNMPDPDHSLIAATKNFSYDTYFYMTSEDEVHTQALEFDINWFLNTIGMTWGFQCRLRGGHEWDLWNNTQKKWVDSGLACTPLKDAWNHLTIKGKRNDDNTLTYQAITLNDNTIVLNQVADPYSVPSDWYGITVNYQMDGDENQTAIKSYVDNFSLTYW
ncbi:MAG: hypothetical protein ABI158_10245 [Edaphobacter sp.]